MLFPSQPSLGQFKPSLCRFAGQYQRVFTLVGGRRFVSLERIQENFSCADDLTNGFLRTEDLEFDQLHTVQKAKPSVRGFAHKKLVLNLKKVKQIGFGKIHRFLSTSAKGVALRTFEFNGNTFRSQTVKARTKSSVGIPLGTNSSAVVECVPSKNLAGRVSFSLPKRTAGTRRQVLRRCFPFSPSKVSGRLVRDFD